MVFDTKSFLLTLLSIFILSIFSRAFKIKEYYFPFSCALLGLISTLLVFTSAFLVKLFFISVTVVGVIVLIKSMKPARWKNLKENISLWSIVVFLFAISCAVFLNFEHFPLFRFGVTDSGLMWANFFDPDTFHKSILSSEIIRSDSLGRINNPFYWPEKLLIHHIGAIALISYGDIFSQNRNIITYACSNWLFTTVSLAYLFFISSKMFFDYLKRVNSNSNSNIISRFLFIAVFTFIISLIGGFGKYYSIFSNASHNPESWWGSFFLGVALIAFFRKQYLWVMFFVLTAGCFKISLAPAALLMVVLLIIKKHGERNILNILMALSPMFIIIFIALYSILDSPNVPVTTNLRGIPYFDFSDVCYWTVRIYRDIYLYLFDWISYGYAGISLMLFSLLFPLLIVFALFKVSISVSKNNELQRFFKIYAFFMVVISLPALIFETQSEIHAPLDPWVTNILMSRIFICLTIAFFLSVFLVAVIMRIKRSEISSAILLMISIMFFVASRPDSVIFVKETLQIESKSTSCDGINYSGSIHNAAILGVRLSKAAGYKYGFAFSIKDKTTKSK